MLKPVVKSFYTHILHKPQSFNPPNEFGTPFGATLREDLFARHGVGTTAFPPAASFPADPATGCGGWTPTRDRSPKGLGICGLSGPHSGTSGSWDSRSFINSSNELSGNIGWPSWISAWPWDAPSPFSHGCPAVDPSGLSESAARGLQSCSQLVGLSVADTVYTDYTLDLYNIYIHIHMYMYLSFYIYINVV